MLSRIEPLRNELKTLEVEANDNRRKNEDMLNVITGLEKSIARYKEEYAVLISQAQAIKADLAAVETKVSVTAENHC
jgi:dynein heavy chain 1